MGGYFYGFLGIIILVSKGGYMDKDKFFPCSRGDYCTDKDVMSSLTIGISMCDKTHEIFNIGRGIISERVVEKTWDMCPYGWFVYQHRKISMSEGITLCVCI